MNGIVLAHRRDDAELTLLILLEPSQVHAPGGLPGECRAGIAMCAWRESKERSEVPEQGVDPSAGKGTLAGCAVELC